MDVLDFKLPDEETSIIKVIGVGGGGCNAVNHMFKKGIENVTFVVCNTDKQALAESPVDKKIQLGADIAKGLGAGNNPDVARQSAEESAEEIRAVLENTEMVFVTAGMGGGTGTGAAPVVARIAKDMGILTVGIVTVPFTFEGPKKINQAMEGVKLMNENVDALLVIRNEKLRDVYPDLNLANAFAKADDVLSDSAKGIAELVTVHGHINLDFADVSRVLRNGGVAVMNSGVGSGENRLTKAIEDTLASPLLRDRDIKGAKKMLLNFYCREDDNAIKMDEITQVNEFMETIGDQVEVIWGVRFDNDLKDDEIKITIIATGFKTDSVLDGQKKSGEENTPDKDNEGDDDEEVVEIKDKPLYNEFYGDTGVELKKKEEQLKDIDNDDIVDELENIPAFKRKLAAGPQPYVPRNLKG